MITPALQALIRALPKTETHLHLEGSLPWPLLEQVAPDLRGQTPASWEPGFRFDSFAQFESQLLAHAARWFNSAERYHEAARRLFTHLRDTQNVRYVETSFASGVIDHLGLDGEEVSAAIAEAAPAGVTVRVFLGFHHDGYTPANRDRFDGCVHWRHLAGIDLHGTESVPLGAWAAPFWRRAREHGLRAKAHAGEFCGPEFVRQVVAELGVNRIQHGVRCIEDPRLVEQLAWSGAVLDVCPISNLKLRVTPSLAAHPLPRLQAAGLRCTVSTDDPMVFGNTLEMEYTALAEHLGYDATALVRTARTGFELALLPAVDKQRLLAGIDACHDAYRAVN